MALAATLAEAFGSDLQSPLLLRFEQVENVLKAHAVTDQLVLELSVFHAGFGWDVSVLVLFRTPSAFSTVLISSGSKQNPAH